MRVYHSIFDTPLVHHSRILNFSLEIDCEIWGDEQDIKKEHWILTEEGEAYAVSGSPEAQLFFGVPPEGISTDELKV